MKKQKPGEEKARKREGKDERRRGRMRMIQILESFLLLRQGLGYGVKVKLNLDYMC